MGRMRKRKTDKYNVEKERQKRQTDRQTERDTDIEQKRKKE
jgi:hypothetical protein